MFPFFNPKRIVCCYFIPYAIIIIIIYMSHDCILMIIIIISINDLTIKTNVSPSKDSSREQLPTLPPNVPQRVLYQREIYHPLHKKNWHSTLANSSTDFFFPNSISMVHLIFLSLQDLFLLLIMVIMVLWWGKDWNSLRWNPTSIVRNIGFWNLFPYSTWVRSCY